MSRHQEPVCFYEKKYLLIMDVYLNDLSISCFDLAECVATEEFKPYLEYTSWKFMPLSMTSNTLDPWCSK